MTDEAQAAAGDLPEWASATLPDGRLAYRVAGSRGVTAEVFEARIRGGWSPERAAYVPMARMRAPFKRPRASLLRSVRLKNGKLAWPVAAAAGMSEATFRTRLARGLSPDDAATLPVMSPSQAGRCRLHPAQKPVGWSPLRRVHPP